MLCLLGKFGYTRSAYWLLQQQQLLRWVQQKEIWMVLWLASYHGLGVGVLTVQQGTVLFELDSVIE